MRIISFEKSVGAVLVRFSDKKPLYLLLKYRSGQWDFPKGHMEKGESEADTLYREIREETGLEGVGLFEGFRESSVYFYRAKGNELKERIAAGRGICIFKKAVYYLAEAASGEVLLNYENSAYAWSDIDEAMERVRAQGSRRILQKAHAFLGQIRKEKDALDVLRHKGR